MKKHMTNAVIETGIFHEGTFRMGQPTQYWTSMCDIEKVFQRGLINRSVKPCGHGYGADYTYSTKEGKEIVTFYKDYTQGFGSQYYGVKCASPIDLYPELFTSEAFAAWEADFIADYKKERGITT